MEQSEKTVYVRDRLRQLRVFCYTAQLQNMSAAADHLSLTQPAVSRQIRLLEKELSTALFERHGSRITLTPAGDRLQQLAKPLVEGFDHLPEAFAEQLAGNVSGRICITVGLTAAAFFLPQYVGRFHAQYPSIKIHVDTVSGADSLQRIRDLEADFGVGAVEAPPDDITFRRVLSSTFTLIVPLDHPLANHETVTVEDISPFSWILPAYGTHSRRAIDTVARYANLKLDIALETNGWSVIKRNVEAGVGIATVPDLCVSAADRVRKIPFDEHVGSHIRPREYGVILRRDAILSLAATRFISMMDPSFPGTAPEKPR